jgi:hypothetical protein
MNRHGDTNCPNFTLKSNVPNILKCEKESSITVYNTVSLQLL